MNREVYVSRYGSVSDFVTACGERRDQNATSSRSGRAEWSGTADYASAATLAADGWVEGRERAEKLAGSMVAQVAGRIQRADWVYDVAGGSVDVGAFLSGDPECFMRQEVFDSPFGNATRHVRILFNGSVSCGVSVETVNARGAAVAALSDLLELAGVAVTVDVAFCGSEDPNGRGAIAGSVVTVKRPDERTDLARLMFYMGHPAAFRRMGFAWFEGLSRSLRMRFGSMPPSRLTYTYPCDAPEEAAEVTIGSGYYDGERNPEWTNPATARAYILKQLEKCGVTLRAD